LCQYLSSFKTCQCSNCHP